MAIIRAGDLNKMGDSLFWHSLFIGQRVALYSLSACPRLRWPEVVCRRPTPMGVYHCGWGGGRTLSSPSRGPPPPSRALLLRRRRRPLPTPSRPTAWPRPMLGARGLRLSPPWGHVGALPKLGSLAPYALRCPPGDLHSGDTQAYPPSLSDTGTSRNFRVRWGPASSDRSGRRDV